MRERPGHRELVDEVLRVLGAVGDDPGELTAVLGVVDVEALGDELGVRLVLGEDDRLAQPVPAVDLGAVEHQVGEHLVDGVGVEQPLVQRRSRHHVGRVAALVVPFEFVPLLLLLLGEVVVVDAFALEPKRHRHTPERDEEPVGDGLLQAVLVGRDAGLQVEQVVGVLLDLGLGCGGEPDEQRVEVVEDRPVLVEHRPVRLVDHDQVEVVGAEPTPPVAFDVDVVDQVHHRRIGRHVHPTVGALVGHEVHRRRVRQVRCERVRGLGHQRGAVREEQHALHPVRSRQQVGQSDHGPRLARPGRHDQQRLAGPVDLERLGDAGDRPLLVVATGDVGIDVHAGQVTTRRASLDHQLRLLAGREPLHRPGRGTDGVVPQPRLVAVRVEDDRPLAEHRLQAVRVQLGLLLALGRAARGALRLDHRQRLAVDAPQHVVGVTDPAVVRHPGDLELTVACLGQLPTGLGEQQVDQEQAGVRLRVVVRVGHRRSGPLRGGHLLAKACQLRSELLVRRRELSRALLRYVRSSDFLLQLTDPRGSRRLRRFATSRREHRRVEHEVGRRLVLAVGARKPVQELEQVRHRRHRLVHRDRPRVVRRTVAELHDLSDLQVHLLADEVLEVRRVDVRAERRVVGLAQVTVVCERPAHRELHTTTRVETRRPRIPKRRLPRPHRLLV